VGKEPRLNVGNEWQVVDHTGQSAPSFDRSTTLAYDRTRLAYQRTATSLITFGFAVYNFHRMATGDQPSNRLLGPHEFALIMVGIGLVGLLLSMIEYWRGIRALSTQYPAIAWSPLPGGVALLVSALGIVALAAIIFRL